MMILQEQRGTRSRLFLLLLACLAATRAAVVIAKERDEKSSSFLRSTTAENNPYSSSSTSNEDDESSSLRRPLLPSPRPRELLLAAGQSSGMRFVWRVADDGEPESAYPLKQCDGDCDDDDDCGNNMICFSRSAGDAVPGCRGGETDDTSTDYCISDSEAPTNTPTIPTNPPTMEPTPLPTPAPTVTKVEVINDNEDGATRVVNDTFLLQALNYSIVTPPPAATHWHAPLLGKCQGICKTDTDCALGLGCYRRTLGGDVPHCEFPSSIVQQSPLLLQFCTYLPTPSPTPEPTLQPTIAPTSDATPAPTHLPTTSPTHFQQYNENFQARFIGYQTHGYLARCEANCWNDWECGEDFVCWGRMGFDYMDAPGCYFDGGNPEGGFDQWTFYNVCVDPKDIPPNKIRYNPEYDINMAYLVGYHTGGNLGHCEANCWSDGDCSGDMICLFRKRDNNKAAPGCYFKPESPGGFSRGDNHNYNICVYPEHLSDEELQSHVNPSMFQMARFISLWTHGDLARCEGNCREDYECSGGLICWGRRSGDDAPGCFFDENAGDGIQRGDDHNICVDPNHVPKGALPDRYKPWMEPQEEKWAYLVSNETVGNLLRCEGHCNDDWECQGSLVCWRRVQDMPAPGCYFDPGIDGGISQESDYNVCIDKRGVKNIHRLKLWWEPGYFWQAERDEQFWCMQQSGESVAIHECSEDPRQLWEIVYLPGEGEEALIKSYHEQQCLRGGGPNLRECNYDGTDEAQNWITMNGDWTSEHFELTRKGYEEFCIANHHHPRNGESIEMRGCERERNYTTSAWTFWW